MKLVMVADTHDRHVALNSFMPEGDVFIHAGDFTMQGEPLYITAFNEWLGTLPYKHKLVIPGNHELTMDEERNPYYLDYRALITNATLLVNQSVIIDGVKFYGYPDTPEFCNWAFNRNQAEMEPIAAAIPDDTDVLITHGPPQGILDVAWEIERDPKTRAIVRKYQRHVGCGEQAKAVYRIKPKVNVFGHIHGSYGIVEENGTAFINASICDEKYRPARKPMVYEI